jgi:hypothetical protein
MLRVADAAGCVGQVTALLGQLHQLHWVPYGHGRFDHQHVGHGGDQRDRRRVTLRRIGHALLEQRGIGRNLSRGRQQQRVAIRRCLRHALGGDHGAGAGAVLHQHRLAEGHAHLLRQQAGDDVHAAAGCVAHQDF